MKFINFIARLGTNEMLSRTRIDIACVGLLLSACNGSTLGDEFSYHSEDDQFTGHTISEALATLDGDAASNSKIEISLSCSYPKGNTPDPFKNTKISFTVTDREGEPKDFSDLTVKFDDLPPPENGFLKSYNLSKYRNVSSHYFSFISVLALPQNERVSALFSLALAINKETAFKIIKAAVGMKTLMIRYETEGGVISTTQIKVEGGNFKKVLNDCGWQEWLSNYETKNIETTKVQNSSATGFDEKKLDEDNELVRDSQPARSNHDANSGAKETEPKAQWF